MITITRYELFVRAIIIGMGIGLGLLFALFIFVAFNTILGFFTKKGNNANRN